MDQSLFLGLSSAAQTKTIMNYFPAFFSEVFESQSDALQQFAHRPGVWTETPLEQGAKFMVLSGQNVGLVLVPRHDGGVEFWNSGPDFGRLSLEEAQEDIEDYEAVLGPGEWRIFKAVAHTPPTP
jgi:hypothetical protein